LIRKQNALLTLDFQKRIFGFAPDAEAIIPNASKAVEFARRKQFLIIHVGHGFSEGHPEIPDRQSRLQRVNENNLFVKGTTSPNSIVLSLGLESWWSISKE